MLCLIPLTVLINVGADAAYCFQCKNAASRGWSWWFGWGDCQCTEGWSGDCCDDWSVSDWGQKVSDWGQGKSCAAHSENACKHISNLPATVDSMRTWSYPPTSDLSTQSQCEETNGCMWVECFPQSGDSLPYSTSIPAEMCSDCGGPWQGKCEWKHYTPGFLAFAGPGEHCGFSYPVCPAIEGKNCFCGQAANKVKEGWCDNGAGMQTFCPNALNHGNGRSQECSWSGWTVSPQVSGGATASCAAWGLETSSGR